MPVTAKSLREKADATKIDGKHDPVARVSLPVSEVLYLASQLDVLAGTEISPATAKRLKEEGVREIREKVKLGLVNMRCAVAGQIARAEVRNMRAAFVANALLDVAEEAWRGATSTRPEQAERLLESTEQMLSAMDRLQELAKWQLVPVLDNVADVAIRPVATLGLSARALNGLHAEGIYVVGDLIQRRQSELRRIPNFGVKSITEILEVLNGLGVKLAG